MAPQSTLAENGGWEEEGGPVHKKGSWPFISFTQIIKTLMRAENPNTKTTAWKIECPYQLNNNKNECVVPCNKELKFQSRPPAIRRNICTQYKHCPALCTVSKSKSLLALKKKVINIKWNPYPLYLTYQSHVSNYQLGKKCRLYKIVPMEQRGTEGLTSFPIVR